MDGINTASGRALVTGAAGFLGKHFTRRLVESGWEVVAIDIDTQRLDALNTECAPEILLLGDVRKVMAYPEQMPGFGDHFDLVVHCAAVVGGRAGIDGDPLGVAQNLALDADVLRWVDRARPGALLYISSSAVYPTYMQSGPQVCPARRLTEEDRGDPRQFISAMPDATYGWAKLTGELLCGYLRDAGQRVHVVRPFSGYGTDQPAGYPFPDIMQRVRDKIDPFPLWCPPGDTRDWVHVDDVIGAALHVWEIGYEGPVNICTGRAVEFGELVRYACQVAEWKPENIMVQSEAPRGVSQRVGNPGLLFELGYECAVTLEEGVRRALGR